MSNTTGCTSKTVLWKPPYSNGKCIFMEKKKILFYFVIMRENVLTVRQSLNAAVLINFKYFIECACKCQSNWSQQKESAVIFLFGNFGYINNSAIFKLKSLY